MRANPQSTHAQSTHASPAARRVAFGPNAAVWTIGLVIAIAFLGGSLLRTINLPWVEEDNWYGGVYSQAAHNNLRAGILTSGGVPATLYFGPLPIPKDAYYVHHPTLLPLLVTGAFWVFGEAEWVARLTPITCSLFSVALLWVLVNSALGARAATLSAGFFATLPMELHYGDMVDFEPCLLMWMLAALVCLRLWDTTRRLRWAVLAAVCCQMALWTDWPGYLFVISIAAGLLVGWVTKRPPLSSITPGQSLRAAVLLAGMVGFSGMLFLLQIRFANPRAWDDLWSALRMRLGNQLVTNSAQLTSDVPLFTLAQWFQAILRGLNADFFFPTWIFALLGVMEIARGWKRSAGLRWCGIAALPMLIAGIFYVVLLRNESYIHDFATFYLIGALALFAGIGLEKCVQWSEQRLPIFWRPSLAAAVLVLFVPLAVFGHRKAEARRSQFLVLDGHTPEPPGFAPSLGRELTKIFPPGTEILCNFDPFGSTLNYYAQREIEGNLVAGDDWKEAIAEDDGRVGGIVWLDAPGASEIVSALPNEQLTPFQLGRFRFMIWRGQRNF